MAKKDYFLIIDTESTMDDKAADFGAVVCDRKGNIYSQCAVLTHGIFDSPESPLFYSSAEIEGLWSKRGQDKRYKKYNEMLNSGSRMLASINAVNRWLENVKGKYNPYLTAYNLPFDLRICNNSNIDLNIFKNSFCLWGAAQDKWATTKKYKNFVLQVHGFNSPTGLGNMTYKTNAEIMARFVMNKPDLPDEPHTALEDILYYELPILKALVKSTKKENWLNANSYDWRKYQVKDHFEAK